MFANLEFAKETKDSAIIKSVQRLSRIINLQNRQKSAAHKTSGATDRLYAEVRYGFSSPGTLVQTDSFYLNYSNNRTSQFNFLGFSYDYANPGDIPFNTFNTTSINFDSIRTYSIPISGNYAVNKYRSYNSDNKIDISVDGGSKKYFDYNSLGQLSKVTQLSLNTSTQQWDSAIRDFYIYDPSGGVIFDSTEYYSASVWDARYYSLLTLNAAGFVVAGESGFANPSIYRYATAKSTATYNANNQPIKSVGAHLDAVTLKFVNFGRDTFGYKNANLVYYSKDLWNSVKKDWDSYYIEERVFSTSSLPDSIYRRSPNSPAVTPTTEYWEYNAQGNPIRISQFSPRFAGKIGEGRFYYEKISVDVNTAQKSDVIDIYPNPVEHIVHFSSSLTGRYTIINSIGVVVQKGSLSVAESLEVPDLVAGLYSILIRSKEGDVYRAKFMHL